MCRAVIAVASMSFAVGALSTPCLAAEPAGDATELARVACAAGHAYAARDIPALDKITADDYVQTDVRGGVLTRLEWREFVRNRKSDLSIECDNVQVRFYGGTAVVTGGWTYTNRKSDGDVTTHSRWTSVWTRDRDGWKRHVFQNTYVNPDADQCPSSRGT